MALSVRRLNAELLDTTTLWPGSPRLKLAVMKKHAISVAVAASLALGCSNGVAAHQNSARVERMSVEVRKFVNALARLPDQNLSEGRKRLLQARILSNLEKLGPASVCAIIENMDDRRPLAVPEMSLANSAPNSFEAVRFYGPELIVDALDAVLNQLTGAGGMIVNGGSEQERRAAVTEWRSNATHFGCAVR